MILIYGGVLNTIEKALCELVKEYQRVGKSLQNLVEGQKRNTAQLERIGATMEQRQDLKEVEEDRDDEEGSKDRSGESQKEKTLLFASYQYSSLV